MNENRLSIIIPVYNVEKYIKKCIECIKSQMNDNIEVIIVDDGTSDKSIEICKEEIAGDFRFVLIQQKNAGLSVARNVGIKYATGDYLLFLDSDDYLAENCLPNLLSVLDGCDKDFIFGKAIKYNDEDLSTESFGVEYNGYKKEMSPIEIFMDLNKNKKFWFAAWLVIAKREFIIKNNLYFKEKIYHEDELWVPQVFIAAKDMYLWDFEFYIYRINRKNSIVNCTNIKKAFDKIIIIQELKKMKDSTADEGKLIINDRSASLVWGLIYQVIKSPDYAGNDELLCQIEKEIGCLKYKKYWKIYLLVKILGLRYFIKYVSYIVEKK